MKSINGTQSWIVTLSLVLVFAGAVGCSPHAATIEGSPGGLPDTTALLASGAISVEDATAEQCPNGGKVYSVYLDNNRNGFRESSESTTSIQILCNGVDGAAGKNSLISSRRVETESCSAGTGLQLQFGLDIDVDNILDAGEISKTEVLCDGRNGAAGADGRAGQNGHSMVFDVVAASPEICPAGGVTTLMALDIFDTGIYSVQLPNQSAMTVCNGANGEDGSDGVDGEDGADGANAVLSPYTPVDIIVPCASTAPYKEVLFRFHNGQVFASFSDNASGLNTRFTIVPDGSYMTTDGAQCRFRLTTSEDRSTRSIIWNDQVQQSWPLL